MSQSNVGLPQAIVERLRSLRRVQSIEFASPWLDAIIAGHGVRLTLSSDARADVMFATALAETLEVRPLREGDLYDFFGNPELTTDDSAFDDRLLLRGKPEVRVRQLFSPDARAALLELQQLWGALELTHERLQLSALSASGASAWLRTVELIGQLIELWSAGAAPVDHPYR